MTRLYERITKAGETLELPEGATGKEIRSEYPRIRAYTTKEGEPARIPALPRRFPVGPYFTLAPKIP